MLVSVKECISFSISVRGLAVSVRIMAVFVVNVHVLAVPVLLQSMFSEISPLLQELESPEAHLIQQGRDLTHGLSQQAAVTLPFFAH